MAQAKTAGSARRAAAGGAAADTFPHPPPPRGEVGRWSGARGPGEGSLPTAADEVHLTRFPRYARTATLPAPGRGKRRGTSRPRLDRAAPAKRGRAHLARHRGDRRAAGGRAAAPARHGAGRPRAVVADPRLTRTQRAARRTSGPRRSRRPTTARPEDIDAFRKNWRGGGSRNRRRKRAGR